MLRQMNNLRPGIYNNMFVTCVSVCVCCECGNSCASVFPESPRWLMATSQIPQAKKCLQSFSARNGMCVSDELYPAETLLSGKNLSLTHISY